MSRARGLLHVRHRTAERATAHSLDGELCLLGRGADAGVRLDGMGVSRRHAELFADDQGWHVRDLGSRNGTLLNGTLVDGVAPLATGDEMKIDEFTLRFVDEDSPTDRIPGLPRASEALELTMMDAGLSFTEVEEGRVRTIRELEPPKISASQLRAVIAFSGELLATESMSERRTHLCTWLTGPGFQGRSATVLRVDSRADEPEPLVVCEPVCRPREPPPYLSRSLIRAVCASRDAAMAGSDGRASQEEMIEMTMMQATEGLAAIACPIRRDGDLLELFYVTLPGHFATSEWLALASLAAEQFEQAELSWEARRAAEQRVVLERELLQAREIQMRLVPRNVSGAEGGLAVAFGFETSLLVGGDYVDTVTLGDGRRLIVVMDVSGKGMQAALVTNGLHTTVHLLADQGAPLVELAETMNRHLLRTLPDASFVTAILVAVDPATGAFEVVNCGHPPAFVVSASGDLREVGSTPQLPLGCLDGALEAVSGTLEPGEMLFAYSDGLFEAEDEKRELLGMARLRELVAQCLQDIHSDTADLSPPGSFSQEEDPTARATAYLRTRLSEYRGAAAPTDDTTFFFARRV